MALAIVLPPTALAARMVRVSDPCLDSMETVPINDDLEPIPVSLDRVCPVPEVVISI